VTIIISDNLVLTLQQEEGFDSNNPIIGWQNLVTPSNLSSGSTYNDDPVEDELYPTANLANTSTYQRFQQTNGGESFWIQVDLNGNQDVDYLAIAGHNFGSKQRSVQVFGALGFDSNGDPDFMELTDAFIPGDNTPLIFRFVPGKYIAIRLNVESSTQAVNDIAYAAVMYVGKLLVMERKIQVSFVPLNYGRRADVTSNRSERGHFLGRTVVGSWLETSATFMYLSPDWYRDNMDDFLKAAQTEPFFFAWAPETYPEEAGYAWLMDNAEPMIHVPGDVPYMQVTLNMQGIVE